MQIIRRGSLALALAALPLSACSPPGRESASEQYGTSQQGIAAEDSVDEELVEPSSSACSIKPEAALLLLDLSVSEDDVQVSISNTLDEQLEGDFELSFVTQLGAGTASFPFEVAALDTVTLKFPLQSLGIDGSIDLAVITGSLRASRKDGSITFAGGETVYDARSTKPEEEEFGTPEESLERVAVAFVSDDIEEGRLALHDAEMNSDALSLDDFSAGQEQPQLQALVTNKTVCFAAGMPLIGAGIGEDSWNLQPSTGRVGNGLMRKHRAARLGRRGG
jgi:hypothetical protein